MQAMISVAPHEYAGRQLGVGDRFDAEDGDVDLLTKLGRAEVAKAQTAEYETRDMAAGPAAKYNRKNLTTGSRR